MLTPIDIQNRNLKTTMGGYNKKDTDDFIAEILASYEELFKENHDLKEKITSLSEGIQYYKQMENTLQKALVLAEKTSSETQEAAKSQAESILREARAKADTIVSETQSKAEITKAQANRELEETRNHVRKLVQSYENYRLQFKKLAASQIEMLDSESFSIYAPELDELVKDAPSADVAAMPESTPKHIELEKPAFKDIPENTETMAFTDIPEMPAAPVFEAEPEKAEESTAPGEDFSSMFLDLPEESDDINSMITETADDEKLDLNDYEQLTDDPFIDAGTGDESDVDKTVYPEINKDSGNDFPDYFIPESDMMDTGSAEAASSEEKNDNPFTFIEP